MPINFPDSPSLNDTHTVGDKTWIYNGSSWDVVIANQAPNQLRDADNDTKIEAENTADDDTLRFSTAGTERMTITSAGHLIPSANVTYDLGSASNRFRDIYLSGTTIDLGGVTISSDGTNITLPPVSNISGDLTVGTDVLHVDHANSRVGIGTTTPATHLEVESVTNSGTTPTEIRISANDDGSVWSTANPWGQLSFWTADGSSGGPKVHAAITTTSANTANHSSSLSIATDPDGNGLQSRLTVTSSGAVGIGTTTPGAALEVARTADGRDTTHINGQLRLQGADPTRLTIEPSNGSSNLWNIDNSAGTLRIFREDWAASGTGTNGAVRVYIQNDGDVGIGTGSPAAKLHVNGEIIHASQWAGCAGPTSWSSAYLNNWGQARGSGSFMTASSTGITINRGGRYYVMAGQRCNSTSDTYIGIGENGNRTTLDSRTTGVWSHDHAGYPSGWTMSHYVGYLASGEKLTAGAPNSTNASYLLFASLGYAGFITAIWLGD